MNRNYDVVMRATHQLRFFWSHQFISILFDSKSTSLICFEGSSSSTPPSAAISSITATSLLNTVTGSGSAGLGGSTSGPNVALAGLHFKEFIRGFFDKTMTRKSDLLNSPDSLAIYRVCSFFRHLLLFFHEPRIEIQSGESTSFAFFSLSSV